MKTKKRLIKAGGIFMKLLLLFIFGWPFFWMLSTSLQTIDEVNRVTPTFFPAVLQFHNYLDAWHSGPDGSMWIYLKNSLIVVVSVILLQIFVVVPASYAFAKYEFKGKKIMFGSILIALMMPTQITFLPVYLMMSKWGLINSLLPQILPFITNAFAIFLLRQYFMQVEDELIEAAKLDGASEWRVILQIMMPMSSRQSHLLFCSALSDSGMNISGRWLYDKFGHDTERFPSQLPSWKEMEVWQTGEIVMAGNAILSSCTACIPVCLKANHEVLCILRIK